jgi:hypothetical protein
MKCPQSAWSIERGLPQEIHLKALPSNGWLSRVLMKSEKASSALRVRVEREALLVVILTGLSVFGFALSGVLRFNGVLVVKDFFWFMVTNKISFQLLIYDMDFAHNVLYLMNRTAMYDTMQIGIEFIAPFKKPLSGGKCNHLDKCYYDCCPLH